MVANEIKKKCTRCFKVLDISNFIKVWHNRQNKHYRKSHCKSCQGKIFKKWKKKNPDWMKKYMNRWEEENKEHRKEYIKKRYHGNKERFAKEYKNWLKKNKKLRDQYFKEFHEKNREKILPKARLRANIRRKDPKLALHDYKMLLRRMQWQRDTGHPRAIWISVKNRITKWNRKYNFKPDKHVMEHVGCSKIFLKEYLTLQFYKDKKTGKMMSWENYGEWDIDHIVPLAHFAKQNKEIRKHANHFLNLRPLWKKENLEKAARLIPGIGPNTIIKKSELFPIFIKYTLIIWK